MDLKKLLASISIVASMTLQSFSQTTDEVVSYEKEIISKLNHNSDSKIIHLYLDSLIEVNNKYNSEIINKIDSNIINWAKENSKIISTKLGLVASLNENILSLIRVLEKKIKQKKIDKSIKPKLISLKHSIKDMENNIQHYIDLTYLTIEAKTVYHYLHVIAKAEKIKLEDYWFSSLSETNTRPLFLITKDLHDANIEDIFQIENKLNNELKLMLSTKEKMMKDIKMPGIGNYDFNHIKKLHFNSVSFL